MASAGTLLSDLESSGGGSPNDGDFVQKILQDMNIPTGGGGGGRSIPPPLPAQAPPMMPPSTQGLTMDSRIPSAHIIGNEHPTPADFAAAMVGATGRLPQASMAGSPYVPGVMPQQQQQELYEPPSKNWYGRIAEEIKIPFLVSLLFFVFSLSPIRVLVAHYVPALIKNTGDYQVTGLLAVSAAVGLTFWVLHRIIAPLLSI